MLFFIVLINNEPILTSTGEGGKEEVTFTATSAIHARKSSFFALEFHLQNTYTLMRIRNRRTYTYINSIPQKLPVGNCTGYFTRNL